jgi:arylsulfatase A-like enzyme
MPSSFLYASGNSTEPPNIILIYAEDLSPDLACYGEPGVETPNLDRLASQGVLFENAFTPAPSCTPARNALLLGIYQTRLNLGDQRLADQHTDEQRQPLPEPYKPFTVLLEDAGYHTALGCGYSRKVDRNFAWDGDLFEARDWRAGDKDQPFFAQITLYATHRGAYWRAGNKNFIGDRVGDPVQPGEVQLPPYYPDHPVTRRDWATYLNTIQYIDKQMGQILNRLEREGIADDTAVVFMGDNGRAHLRGKCWLYDPGIHVPLIIRWPDGRAAGTRNTKLVSGIDITATILDLANVTVPQWMDGRSIASSKFSGRDAIFSARDRVDEAEEAIRAVRTDRYKYIRNFLPHIPRTQPFAYVRRHRPMWPIMERLWEAGKLKPHQAEFFAPNKPVEELYDLKRDPHELNNLADSPHHQDVLRRLRKRLRSWTRRIRDRELAEHYDRGRIAPNIYQEWVRPE